MKFSQFLIMLVVGSAILFPIAQLYDKALHKQKAIIEIRSIVNDHSLAVRDHLIYTKYSELSLEDIKKLELKLKMNTAFKYEPPSNPFDEIREINYFWEGVKVISFEDHNIKLTHYSDELLIEFIKLKASEAGIEASTIVRDFLREKHEKKLKERLRKEEQRLKKQLGEEEEEKVNPKRKK